MLVGSKHKKTLVEKVYQSILNDIITHKLEAGTKINIKELANQYGTSEMPVKLALNRLIAENIIINKPHQGMRVFSLTARDVEEIFQLRTMIDLYDVNHIIKSVSANSTLLEEMENCNKEMEKEFIQLDKSFNVESYLASYRYDMKFHELYLSGSGNRRMVQLFRSIHPFGYTYLLFQKQTTERNMLGVKEHRQIVQALKSQDEALVRKYIIQHNQNAAETIKLFVSVNDILNTPD
jgi:DNA-binding GntR family transcriptional regulator